MVRKTLYDRLDNLGVKVSAEYDALIRLLKIEKPLCYKYSNHSVMQYINDFYFRQLPVNFRAPYLSVEEMMVAIEIPDFSYELDDLFLLSEFLMAILPSEYTKQNKVLEQQALLIKTNIISFLEKLNYELKNIGGGRKIIVEKNPATTQAVRIVNDNSTAIALIEYNHYVLRGKVEEKRKILTVLGSYIEPVLKSRVLQNAGYKQLESDVGFMLNNFHVRHNNKEGAKAQDYIIELNAKQLEEWYDKIYNTILSVIIINEHIPTQNSIADLKFTYNWRT